MLLVAGALVNLWGVAGEARVARNALVDFPAQLDGWTKRGADARFDAATEAVLRADDYVSRDYVSKDGRVVSLYIGYYLTQRTGATYHSPLNCLPGSGWTLDEPATIQINPADGGPAFEANRYIIRNGNEQQLLIYWYHGRGRAVASEYWDKVYTVLDSIRLRRSDGSMVRVLVPFTGSESDAMETGVGFASLVEPRLAPYVPE